MLRTKRDRVSCWAKTPFPKPLSKSGLEVIPRRWKVVQTVREKFSCRACEAITQPPAPFHPIARGRAGPNLLATVLEAKFGQHLPLNRQSETYARRWCMEASEVARPPPLLVQAARTETGLATRIMRLSTSTAMAASPCCAGKPRARSLGPMVAL